MDSAPNTKKALAAEKKAAAKTKAKEARAAEKATAKAEKEQDISLAAEAEKKLLKDLKASIKTHAHSATFACGGTVYFTTATTEVKAETEPDTSEPASPKAEIAPIQIRFGDSGKGTTVTLPCEGSSHDLQQLIASCQPATFGRGGEEVLDDDYRKAGKLDTTAFVTTFCPYNAGIVDVVAQLLVPQTSQEKHVRSLKAELYKLNVYGAPGGKFKAHVDTPRDKSQIGSLVVSLPVDHQGGQLAVRHAGQKLLFDWSASKNTDTDNAQGIQWAAFYSDCEHEVFEVTSGHRITLTYNLFVTRGLGHLVGASKILNTTQLPFYATLRNALAVPRFLRGGRILAIWLNHSYAHTNTHINFLPHSLKGADMSLYETANALGLKCHLVSVIERNWGWDGPSYLANSSFYSFNRGHGGASLGDESEPGWGHEMPDGQVTWLNPDPKMKDAEKMKMSAKETRELRDKNLEEAQCAYLTYGNEPGIDIHYSRAAMLIRIPPYKERYDELQPPKSIWAGIRDDYEEDGDFNYERYDDGVSDDFYDDDESMESYDEDDGDEDDEETGELDQGGDEEMAEDAVVKAEETAEEDVK